MKAALYTTQILSFIFFIIISFSCQKEFSRENHIAKGTLKDGYGICFPSTVNGKFYNGITPDGNTTFVEVKVNVTATGSYSIFTDIQNGFRFADSGIFKNTGINIIKLKPTGTPVIYELTDLVIRFDTSVCTLTINVLDSASLNQNNTSAALPLNNWRFTDSKRGLTYRGLFENNFIYLPGSLNVLILSTKNAQAPGDSTFMINIGLPKEGITLGTYNTDVPPNGIVFKTFSDACLNCAGGGLIPRSSGATVNIIITDYSPTTKIVKGQFSGTTIDFFNEVAIIKGGVFSAAIK